MKLSTKSTYGVRAMLNIALAEDGTVSIADISRREGISVPYLEQLLHRLRKSGLITSVRGPKGGYILARRSGEITVKDIVTILEGGIYPVHCVSGGGAAGACKRRRGCVPKLVWVRLARAISDCLGSITLADLCAEARQNGDGK